MSQTEEAGKNLRLGCFGQVAGCCFGVCCLEETLPLFYQIIEYLFVSGEGFSVMDDTLPLDETEGFGYANRGESRLFSVEENKVR